MRKQPYDPERCAATVHDGGRSVRFHQCERRIWQDGWCKQHHPETVKKRQEEGNRRYRAQQDAQIARYKACGDKYLRDEVKRLSDDIYRIRDLVWSALEAAEDHPCYAGPESAELSEWLEREGGDFARITADIAWPLRRALEIIGQRGAME